MRIREARMRDAIGVIDLLPEAEKKTVDEMIAMIQKREPVIYVGTDFGANMLGCALGSDKVYISPKCLEVDAIDALKKMYE